MVRKHIHCTLGGEQLLNFSPPLFPGKEVHGEKEQKHFFRCVYMCYSSFYFCNFCTLKYLFFEILDKEY